MDSPPSTARPTTALQRPITPRARRQSWMEPSVRAWWMMALALSLAVAYFAVEQYALNSVIRRHIATWRPQTVTIDKMNNSTRKTYVVPAEVLAYSDVDMSYLDAEHRPQHLFGRLPGQSAPLSPGGKINLLINPNNPSEYADRITPTPFAELMIIPAIILPFPIAFAIVAWVKRRRTLHLWQTGELREATVMDITKSALSPRSTIARCTIPRTREKRLFRLAVPRRILIPRPGNTLQVITPAGEPNQALAAILYE